ncbi:hypothetical protein CHS0354_025720 [Potamilus streckersoni]|uniref:Tetraspanin n=1 Tax=Potamilus streckersoni TaxID=2493646 RepID=A0AAE0VML2_9BIVA|nr:hypothetical protein CHS0354_025720 [Potamilus streckersoni]
MAELSCGLKCCKYILFLVNLLVFMIGAAAVAVGIWALADKTNKLDPLTKIGANTGDFNVVGLLQTGAIVMVVGGGIVVIISFLGCCGAIKENSCMMCLYAGLLILILLLEVAAVVLAAVFRSKFEAEAKGFLKNNINNTYQGILSTKEPFSLAIDFAQVWFDCCGIDNYTDFEGAVKWNKTISINTTMKIPPSCCILNKDAFFKDQASVQPSNANCTQSGDDSNMNKSCWKNILDFLQRQATIVLGVAIGVVAAELLCIISACCLWSTFRQEK